MPPSVYGTYNGEAVIGNSGSKEESTGSTWQSLFHSNSESRHSSPFPTILGPDRGGVAAGGLWKQYITDSKFFR